MLKKFSNPILISCRESIQYDLTNFYGRFYLGPFEFGQGLTIANSLRRTLLSELSSLAITSVEIEGVTHEYCTLPGVEDSIVDLLLNLKQIVLKSLILLKKPQIAYIKKKGPGIVKASDLILPSFLKSVDSNQYITKLSHDGVLNVKLKIRQGQNFMIHKPLFKPNDSNQKNFEKTNISKFSQIKLQQNIIDHVLLKQNTIQQPVICSDSKKLINKSSNEFFAKYGEKDKWIICKSNSLRKSILKIDATFMPILKTNYLLEVDNWNFSKIIDDKSPIKIVTQNSLLSSENSSNCQQNCQQNNILKTTKLLPFFEAISQKKINNLKQKLSNFENLPTILKNLMKKKKGLKTSLTYKNNFEQFNSELFFENQIEKFYQPFSDYQKELIILEIWTNGSIMPQTALKQAIQKLFQMIIKLKKAKMIKSI